MQAVIKRLLQLSKWPLVLQLVYSCGMEPLGAVTDRDPSERSVDSVADEGSSRVAKPTRKTRTKAKSKSREQDSVSVMAAAGVSGEESMKQLSQSHRLVFSHSPPETVRFKMDVLPLQAITKVSQRKKQAHAVHLCLLY